jgi:hypothetical protein
MCHRKRDLDTCLFDIHHALIRELPLIEKDWHELLAKDCPDYEGKGEA